MTRNDFGWFGWFSAAGFVILGALYLLDAGFENGWPFSESLTLFVALIAGVGALALYFGDDPTAGNTARTGTNH